MSTNKLFLALGCLILAIPLVTFLVIKNPLSNVLSATTKSYTIFLVGDSMTQFLGTGTPELQAALKKYYPKTTFNIYNYGKGSTNILTINDRLDSETEVLTGDKYPPILQRDFDLIIIESFGHNPLSQYPIPQGLKIQTQILDQIIAKIKAAKPKAKIIFLATIAPNRERYAENTVNLMPDARHQWADERTAYIKNHMDYAKSHNIPLIDVYTKSLENGTGSINFINTTDFIHPSPTGIILISNTIADYIAQKKFIK